MERIEKKELKKLIRENVKTLYRKTLENASPEELYQAAVFAVRDVITDKWMKTHDEYYERDAKVVYYLSMEFLMGRFFGNALINLEMFDEVKEVFAELGIDYNMVEEAEPDPGLGNGGLGRLAACFLESLSTLSLPAYGCGIRYHYGIFEQRIENGYQVEVPDNWLENGDPWGIKRNEYAVEVKFGGNVRAVEKGNGEYRFVQENYQSVTAIPYDYPVIGYGNNTVNTLRLWEAKPKTRLDLKSFNEGNYQKAAEEELLANTLTDVLYPADEHIQGKELRLRQQYFFISATVQRVIARFKKKHTDFNELPDKVAFQLNDTHPSMAVAELMRVLVDENDLPWDQAWDITRRVCAYTNHTIMSEALEKWPMELFSRLLPRIYQIVEEINRRFVLELTEKYGNNPDKIRKMAIIADGQIRMAFLAIVGSHSVNGVAALHTEILKKQELHDFYELYPEKFNNKTNGITQRRWLLHANPKLAEELRRARPKDQVINACVGPVSGETLDFHVLSADGLSAPGDVSEVLRANPAVRVLETIPMQTVAVNDLMEQLGGAPKILNLDIEGMEMEILRSIDFAKYRPTTMIIEMIPYSKQLVAGKKNPEILRFMQEKGYVEYAFTGINSIFLDKQFYEKITGVSLEG